MKPYLFHCEAPSHSKRGMEEINLRHCGCLLLLLQDVLQYHRPDPHDLNRARQPPTGATMLSAMPQGRDGQPSIGLEL